MFASQTTTPVYSFLSQPPPQKKRPTQPLPLLPVTVCRRRSATVSAVSAWVATVQPGSPAPCSPPLSSPRRRSSLTRRSSVSSRTRRPSVGSGRVPSGSFLNFFDTPTTASITHITPSVKDFKHDVTTVGYTSVFVRLPTPTSPASAIPEKLRPAPAKAHRTLKRFRSLSALRPSRIRAKPSSMPPTPPPKPARNQASEAVKKSKKAKYAKYRPPPLAAELALMQFADGGKMEDNIRRFAEAQARAAGATVVDGKLVGVGDFFRDGEGGIWRDQDEEWEYAHLLGGDEALNEVGWVRFGSASSAAEDEQRRESVSSADSDLDPRYAMQPEERDDLAVFGGTVHPSALRKPGMSVLALPSRSRRSAKHLRKPEFLLDIFPVPDAAADCVASHSAQGKPRRRPAPLTLTPPSPAFKCPTNPLDADQVRKDFIDSSFTPTPPPKSKSANPVPARIESRAVVPPRKTAPKIPMKMDVRGLLRAMGGKKASGDI
ncbi:hypothetical protein BKA93DRAFT_799959 [Sparassis latifolia]